MAKDLKARIKQLETERDSMLLASRRLAEKHKETKAPTFKRMASAAVNQVEKIQREIEQLNKESNPTRIRD